MAVVGFLVRLARPNRSSDGRREKIEENHERLATGEPRPDCGGEVLLE